MEQSDPDTLVNRRTLSPQKDADRSWYSQDTITHRNASFRPVQYPQTCTVADYATPCGSSVLLQANLGRTCFACYLIWICSNDPDL